MWMIKSLVYATVIYPPRSLLPIIFLLTAKEGEVEYIYTLFLKHKHIKLSRITERKAESGKRKAESGNGPLHIIVVGHGWVGAGGVTLLINVSHAFSCCFIV